MRIIVGVLVIFGFGVLMGNKMATPEVDIVKVPGPSKTVTETKVVTETVLPESCKHAMAAASELWEYGSNLYANGTRQVDIISQVRLYIGTGRDLDELYLKQKRLHSDEVGDLQSMSEAIYQFKKYNEECEAEQ